MFKMLSEVGRVGKRLRTRGQQKNFLGAGFKHCHSINFRRCCYFACGVSPVSPHCFNPVIEINGILQPLKEHSSAETNCSRSYLPSPLSRCSIFSISVLTEARFRWSVLLRHAPFSSARTTFFFLLPPFHIFDKALSPSDLLSAWWLKSTVSSA